MLHITCPKCHTVMKPDAYTTKYHLGHAYTLCGTCHAEVYHDHAEPLGLTPEVKHAHEVVSHTHVAKEEPITQPAPTTAAARARAARNRV